MAARFILSAYLFNKPHAKETDINSIEFNLPVHKEIQKHISECYKTGNKLRFNDLYEILADEFSEEISRLAGMETEETKAYDQATYFFDCVKTLKIDKLTREIEKLTMLFKSETDNEKRRAFATEMSKLLSEKSKLL